MKEGVCQTLLESLVLNEAIQLNNRFVMAPMTRCFAENHAPTEAMALYYGKRSGAGLIISEATMITEDATGYPNTPGIFSEACIQGWKRVSEEVHQGGSLFFLQLWHAGMMSHPIYRNGKPTLAPSNVPPRKKVIPRTGGKLYYENPKPMTEEEIQEIVQSFASAASNALKAGCDGIEFHAANGYLLDTFLHWHTNRREDAYGGSAENMCRFILEVVDGVSQEIGAERVGIRLSPVPVPSMDNMEEDVRDQEVFIHLLHELEKRKIAYVHVSSDNDVEECGHLNRPITAFMREHYKGTLIGCGSYTLETATQAIQGQQFDLAAFGRLFISNPDLVERVRQGGVSAALKPFDPTALGSLD